MKDLQNIKPLIVGENTTLILILYNKNASRNLKQ